MTKNRDLTFSVWMVILLTLSVAIPALSHNLFRPITTNADPDILHIFQSLLMNDGRPQNMFDHTGYILFVMLTYWFKILHFLNIVPIIKLSDLLDQGAITPYYEMLIYGGRVFSILLSVGCAVTFYFIVKILINNRYLALFAATLFAWLPGLTTQAYRMRTELPSVFFVLLALLFVLMAFHSGRWREYWYLALASFFAVLATMSKLQIIPMVLALPALIIILRGGFEIAREPAEQVYKWPQIILGALAVGTILVPVLVMIFTQIYPALPERSNVGNAGYQWVIVCYLLITIFLFAKIDRRTNQELALAFCAIGLGFATGFYTNLINHQVQNIANLVNFVEHMTVYASATSGVMLANVESGILFSEIVAKLLAVVSRTFTNHFLTFNLMQATVMPFFWIAAIGALMSAHFKQWRLFLTVIALLLIGLGMQIFSGLRYFAEHYRLFTEPMALLAVVLLVNEAIRDQNIKELLLRNIGFKIASATAVLVLAYVVIGSVSYAFADKNWNEPSNGCYQLEGYAPKKLIVHFCNEAFLKSMERSSEKGAD